MSSLFLLTSPNSSTRVQLEATNPERATQVAPAYASVSQGTLVGKLLDPGLCCLWREVG